jgi:hypothetical protein
MRVSHKERSIALFTYNKSFRLIEIQVTLWEITQSLATWVRLIGWVINNIRIIARKEWFRDGVAINDLVTL